MLCDRRWRFVEVAVRDHQDAFAAEDFGTHQCVALAEERWQAAGGDRPFDKERRLQHLLNIGARRFEQTCSLMPVDC
jgi:hypothetical protein